MHLEKNNNSTKKGTLIYDGNCDFCKFWVYKWKTKAGFNIEFIPLQKTSLENKGLSKKKLKTAVHFLEASGKSFEGAEAVFKMLAVLGNKKWLFFYKVVPGFKIITEFFYRRVVHNRAFLYKIMKLLRIIK